MRQAGVMVVDGRVSTLKSRIAAASRAHRYLHDKMALSPPKKCTYPALVGSLGVCREAFD